jgi:hypothetical protein
VHSCLHTRTPCQAVWSTSDSIPLSNSAVPLYEGVKFVCCVLVLINGDTGLHGIA